MSTKSRVSNWTSLTSSIVPGMVALSLAFSVGCGSSTAPAKPAAPAPSTSAPSGAAPSTSAPAGAEKPAAKDSGAAPSTSAPAAPAKVNEIIIGAVLPMTGGNAPNGFQIKSGYEMAVDEVNAEGGIKALGGAKLKLVIRDHEGKPDVGVRQAEAMVNDDKVVVALGTYMSGVTVPVSRATERLKTPLLVTDSMADEITQGGLKYLFRIDTKAELATKDMLRGIKAFGDKLGSPVTKIALLNEDSAFGQSLKVNFEKQAPELGLQIVENSSFKTGAPDLSAQAARIKASGAQWTVGSWYITDMLTIIKTFPSQGLNPTRASTFGGGMQTPSLLQAGDQAEGVTGFTMWNPDLKKERVKEVGEKFEKQYNVPMNQNGAKAYAGIWILKDVLERAASTDKEKVREALVKTELAQGPAMIMPNSKITFDQTGQLQPSHIGIQVQKGRFVTVWPDDVAAVQLDQTKVKQGMVLQ
ncbi:MAG: ABC transporter substrate-binding protein [Chloroflexi bacterium]|nr:ABC transporter substrate-binding protein [Chloroflexota bacterium]